MPVKLYGESPAGRGPERKNSPGVGRGTRKRASAGTPDIEPVSTS